MTGPPIGRTTRQRTAILTALEHSSRFVSAQELHDELRHSGTAVG
jgi:Fur family transcriptional regulator, ferric uptake regulator